jgi:hypothetical protein
VDYYRTAESGDLKSFSFSDLRFAFGAFQFRGPSFRLQFMHTKLLALLVTILLTIGLGGACVVSAQEASPTVSPSSAEKKGTVIKFDQASEKYRVSGWNKSEWNKSEGDFAWSEGKTAKLSLPVPTNVGPLTVTMTMRGLIQPPAVPVQSVEFYANGKKIADWQVRNTAPFTAEIPAELTRGQDNLNFEFRIPDATSPKALGMNEDGRILGVCVYSIELKRS